MNNSMAATWINFYGKGDDNESTLDVLSSPDPQAKYVTDSMWNGRVLISAYIKSANNPEYKKKGASDVRKPEETQYVLWFDIYEVTGLDANILYGDIQLGSQRIPFFPGKKKQHKNYSRFNWDDSPDNNGRMINVDV